MKLSALKQDRKNANKGTARGRQLIQTSLRSYGAGRSILLDKNLHIIAGNKTAEGAAAVGLENVVVVPTDGKTLIAVQRTDLDINDPEARELAIADNRTSEVSLNWDPEVLQDMRDQCDLSKFWTAEELEQLGPDLVAADAPDAQVDRAAELQQKWKTELGQLWEIPSRNCPGFSHRLLCGDATDATNVKRLFEQRRAALVVTDPPYGVDYESDTTGAIANDGKTGDELAGMLIGALELAVKYSEPRAAFYIWHASSTRRDFEYALDAVGLEEKQYITWAKDSLVLGHADYHWQSEPCFYAQKAGEMAAFYGDRAQTTVWRLNPQSKARGLRYCAIAAGLRILNGRGAELYISERAPKRKRTRTARITEGQALALLADGGTDCWSVSHERQGTLHPNQKPVELAGRAIRNSTMPAALVYDPFAGAGFTVLACELHGRIGASCDLDPKFVAVILERMSDLGLTPKRT